MTNSNARQGLAKSKISSSTPNDYFAIVPRGPALDPVEVETNVKAIEVMVLWGERDILQISHLSMNRAFVVGEDELGTKDAAPVDFHLEAAFLGAKALTLVAPSDGRIEVNVPLTATICVHSAHGSRDDSSLRTSGELRASTTMRGALAYTLSEGESARVSFKGFVFQVKSVAEGFVPRAAFRPDLSVARWVGGVGSFFCALFLVGSFLMPDDSLLGGETLNLEDRYVSALIESRETPPSPTSSSGPSEASDGSGQASRGESGEMGARDRPRADRRSARAGTASESELQISNQSSSESAAENNAVTNAVATIASIFSSGPTSEFGATQEIGGDAMSVLGNLLGAQIGASGGMGGLGLVGSGLGGGGTGAGTYGTGDALGTLGRSSGNGGDDYGRNGDGALGSRGPVVPRVRCGGGCRADVSGGLTADQIRRVIQRNVPQVQHCYEQGLQRNPSLSGRVTVSFVINATGAVGSASADNGMGDEGVRSCVASAVRRWAFPQPDPAGPVSVRFPFNMSRSGE